MGNLSTTGCVKAKGNHCVDGRPEVPPMKANRVGSLRKQLLLQKGTTKVGEGSFGQVLLVPRCCVGETKADFPVAVKVMPRRNSASAVDHDALALKESYILSVVGNGKCANVVRFFGWLQDRRIHCIVTEYCSGGELLEHLIRTADCAYSEAVASEIVRQVLHALEHCHGLNVAHLDVKLENLVLANREDLSLIKLIDFGCALRTASDDGQVNVYEDFCGTLEYAPPEVLKRYARVEGDMLKAVDMWSVGVLAYILSTGNKPFSSSAVEKFRDLETKRKIYAGEFEIPVNVSPVLLDFISRLLVVNPEERMTVVEALTHPWISRPFSSHADYEFYDPMVLAGLKDFHQQSLLKKHVASYLSKLLTPVERERVLASFSLVDSDNSGFLETAEIVRILMVALDVDEETAWSEAKDVFSEFDNNDDGVISVEEFSQVVLRGALGLDQSRVRSAFRILDRNGDGMLSKEEIVSVLVQDDAERVQFHCQMENFVSSLMSQQLLERVISESDSNADGLISFEEFEWSMKVSYPLSV
eukprot:TRINITY_DN2361_c0_g1_i1.p1 TRINITY_DN2361_c0_g1~~TRINITY_DN2361_c0_g1_i1.p1  ORF type:complete len:530 (-),score=131.07 TRINITY_DN2361_c0_g1_i1:1349-2938(-)